MKRKYYPNLEEITFILEEKLNSNIRIDTLYSVPFLYPCDKTCHYHLDVMAVLTSTDQDFYKKLVELTEYWTDYNKELLYKLHNQHKGRPIDYE